MTEARDSIRRSLASGAAWMISFRMADRLIGVVSTAVLARLLAPEHFGVIALGTSLIALIDAFLEFGFELALIRDQESTDEHYHTAWTAQVIKALVVFTIINAGAGLAAQVYAEPGFAEVIHYLSFTLILSAAQSIRITDLRKDLEFRDEFLFRLGPRICGFVLTFILAFLLRNHWALIYSSLATGALRLIASYVMKPYWPKPTLSRFSEIFDFSKWLLVSHMFSTLTKRSPALVIARLAGTQTLGFYSIAVQVCSIASSELIAPVKRALFPGYAKLASDRELLKAVYVENFSVIVLLAMPISAGIGLTADSIVPLFLGTKWLAAVPLMQILAIGAALRTIHTNSNPLFYATNRPSLLFIESVVEVGVLLPVLWFAVPRWGAAGAAAGTAFSNLTVMLFDAVLVIYLLDLRWTKFVSAVWRTIVAVLVMCLVVTWLKGVMTTSTTVKSLLANLLLSALVGAITYIVVHLLLWRLSGSPGGAESILVRFIRQALSRYTIGRRALSGAE
jgi:O-antigen/teichoic acid export membrane protein